MRPRVSGCAEAQKTDIKKQGKALRNYRLWRFYTALRCIIITQLSVAYGSTLFARGSPPLSLPDKGPRPLTLCLWLYKPDWVVGFYFLKGFYRISRAALVFVTISNQNIRALCHVLVAYLHTAVEIMFRKHDLFI